MENLIIRVFLFRFYFFFFHRHKKEKVNIAIVNPSPNHTSRKTIHWIVLLGRVPRGGIMHNILQLRHTERSEVSR